MDTLTKFEFRWLVDDLVCAVTFPEDFKGEMLDEYDQMITAVLNQATHRIHLVVDVRQARPAASLNQSLKIKHMSHPHLGWALIIGLQINAASRFIVSLAAKAAGISYKSFDTFEQAYDYLEHMEGIRIQEQSA